ncbi:MAG: hypothetical protein R2838_21995 [Caldilineaceae bacterium]
MADFRVARPRHTTHADHSRPYPFYLAYQLEGEIAELGRPEWQVEWRGRHPRLAHQAPGRRAGLDPGRGAGHRRLPGTARWASLRLTARCWTAKS